MFMRWVLAHHRKLLVHERTVEITQRQLSGFGESITRGAIHELLFPSPANVFPLFPALLAAHKAMEQKADHPFSGTTRTLMWIDSTGAFYPPAAISLGISPRQLCLLRPRPSDLIWAITECLRCQSIGAVVALITQPLNRIEVRRLQLAAEKSGAAGVLLRPNLARAGSHIYAAATRWLIAPVPGERSIQRWQIQLLHGHGRQIGQSFILEKHRASGQTNLVHLSPAVVDHPAISAAS
jgi:hypothetical protein